MKVMISQPMAGKHDADVKAIREELIEKFKRKFIIRQYIILVKLLQIGCTVLMLYILWMVGKKLEDVESHIKFVKNME